MGAEIVWFSDEAVRVGAIRYGPAFSASGARHAYDGCGVTVDAGGGRAIVGPIGSDARRHGGAGRLIARLASWATGRPAEFSRADWTDILAAHAREGFDLVEFERHGTWYEVNLTRRPWRMRRVRRRAAPSETSSTDCTVMVEPLPPISDTTQPPA